MVKQILPEFGQTLLVKSFESLEFGRPTEASKLFTAEALLSTVNEIIQKLLSDFRRELATLLPSEEQILSEPTQQSPDSEVLQKCRQKVDNLRALFEVELQRKFTKAKVCTSNSEKFEKELQRQLAMKLSKKQKLSLAIYQERFIQEFIKEKYQVLKADNETLQQSLVGHECLQ